MKRLSLFIIVLMVCVAHSFAQGTAVIKTSAICGMCKTSIEKALSMQKGVTASNLDVDSKQITVSFDEKKTDVNKIRKAISKVGYDADEVTRNKKSFAKLPACCKGEVKMKEGGSTGEGVKGTKEKVKKGCCSSEMKKSCGEL